MDLKIFDVEHGACALLTCDNGSRVMIDCGHNTSTGWYPGSYLNYEQVKTLELLLITNYDEDHVSGLANLLDNVDVRWLGRNKAVSSGTIRKLKSEDGMGPGIDRLVHAIDHVFTGDGSIPQPVYQGLKRTQFWNTYPAFDDENNLSLVLHMECNGVGVLFPGDMEKAGWLKLLEREDFRNALRNTKVLVASHHGRESGCCEEVFEYCKPFYTVISDKGYMHNTQETVPFYRANSQGGPFRNGEKRHVLTTRNDGRIGFTFNADGWWPY